MLPSILAARAYHEGTHGHTRSHSRKESNDSPTRSQSHSRSRAASPLRAFLDRWPALHRAHSREEPFVPIDPFRSRAHSSSLLHRLGHPHHHHHHHRQGASEHDPERGGADTSPEAECEDVLACCGVAFGARMLGRSTHEFVTDTLPRQTYLHFLMRLPSVYFSRVARIFEDAEVSRPDIERMIDACMPPVERAGQEGRSARAAETVMRAERLPFPEEWTPPLVSPALVRFKQSWEAFIDSLLREWKTLNVVSALLLTYEDLFLFRSLGRS